MNEMFDRPTSPEGGPEGRPEGAATGDRERRAYRALRRDVEPPAGLEDRIMARIREAGCFDRGADGVPPVSDVPNRGFLARLSVWMGTSPHWQLAAGAVALLLVFGVGREVGKRQGVAAVASEQNEIIFDSLRTWYELEVGRHVHTHTCFASEVDGRRFCILEKAQPLFTSAEDE